MAAPGSLRRSGSGSTLGYLFRGSFDEVHCRCHRTVQSASCFRVRPRGFFPDAAFGREQSNSTGGTRTRVATSFTGAHPNSEIKTASRHQSLGHKRFGKISPDPCGYAGDFPNRFCSNILTHPGHFNFGVRVKLSTNRDPGSRGRRSAPSPATIRGQWQDAPHRHCFRPRRRGRSPHSFRPLLRGRGRRSAPRRWLPKPLQIRGPDRTCAARRQSGLRPNSGQVSGARCPNQKMGNSCLASRKKCRNQGLFQRAAGHRPALRGLGNTPSGCARFGMFATNDVLPSDFFGDNEV